MRTGGVITGSASIVTAVIGAGVLSLAWATAQCGWVRSRALLQPSGQVARADCRPCSADCWPCYAGEQQMRAVCLLVSLSLT